MENIKINCLPDEVDAPKGISTTRNKTCKRIWSNDKHYLYVTPIRSYELFERHTRPARRCINGTITTLKDEYDEIYPKDDDFGDFAWSFSSLDNVFRFLNIEKPKDIVLPF